MAVLRYVDLSSGFINTLPYYDGFTTSYGFYLTSPFKIELYSDNPLDKARVEYSYIDTYGGPVKTGSFGMNQSFTFQANPFSPYPNSSRWATITLRLSGLCNDERTYADTYRITIQGTSKLGNPVTIVQDYNFSGGGEFWLEDHEANLKGWYSIERVAIRALGQNVTSKNGVIQLIVREYLIPTSREGIAVGAMGGFSEDVTFATAVFRKCQLFADISTTGYSVRNRYLSFFSSLAVSVTGFLDSGVVCCDDYNDDSEKSGGGDRPLPPADCDCVGLQVQIQNLYRLVLELSQGGTQGPPGPQGIEGPRGIQGPKGDKGDKGDTGDIGPKGDKGDKGDTGATGPQGPQGPQGIQGQQGPQGIQGQAGEDGVNGADGWISEVEYMTIEGKLQGILDQLKCADRSIACILEKALIFDKSTPSGDVERGLVEVVDQAGVIIKTIHTSPTKTEDREFGIVQIVDEKIIPQASVEVHTRDGAPEIFMNKIYNDEGDY